EERSLAAAVKSGPAALLLTLGGDLLAATLEQPWSWLRQYSRQFFTRLCQRRESEVTPLPVPEGEELQKFMATAPPFPGMEFLSPALLGQWWRALAVEVQARVAAHPQGLAGWLALAAPAWHR